jgi:hypothetical protein
MAFSVVLNNSLFERRRERGATGQCAGSSCNEDAREGWRTADEYSHEERSHGLVTVANDDMGWSDSIKGIALSNDRKMPEGMASVDVFYGQNMPSLYAQHEDDNSTYQLLQVARMRNR